MPLFSVLIANYNNDIYIDTAINSVLNQSFTDWEIVIVDDCSTDNSLQVLSKYSDNSRINIFKNSENKGVGYTKDRCVQLAEGEFCGFLDPDDALTINALEVMVNAFSDYHDCGLIYSTHYLCDERLNVLNIADYVGVLTHNDFLIAQPEEKTISHFVVFKKITYKKTEGISLEMKKAVDRDLYYMLEELGFVHYIDIPLYYYRHHSGNISLGGMNDQIAMFWDYEAKRRAFNRRIEKKHPLYLYNKKLYNEQNLYATIISARFLKKKNKCISILKAYYVYFSNSKFKDLSIYRIIGSLLPTHLKAKIFHLLKNDYTSVN